MRTQVAIVFRKVDGKIVRVSALTDSMRKKLDEKDVSQFYPGGVDTSHLNMVFVEGKEYLDIDKYKVEIDDKGEFLGVVERMDVLTSYNPDDGVAEELLDREAAIVVSVLSVIDDESRLLRYKEAEAKGRNRPEVMNFFKERGI